MGTAWAGGRRLNQRCASLSLFVNEGVELPGPQGPAQQTLEDSTFKSVSTQACQAGSDKLPYHVVSTISSGFNILLYGSLRSPPSLLPLKDCFSFHWSRPLGQMGGCWGLKQKSLAR